MAEEKKRREKGDGSISQRKDGLWVGRYDAGKKPDGKRNIKVVYGKTDKECKKKLKDLKREIEKGEHYYIERSSVEAYMTDWLVNVKKNELKPKSYDRLEQTLNNNVFPYIGHIQLQAIETNDVQKMINDLRDSGKSHSTIKKVYDAVNAAFKYGLACKPPKVDGNPAFNVTIPSKKILPQKKIQFYTKEEAALICDHAISNYKNGNRHYRLGAFVPLLVNTGLRMSELLALKWNEDVDLENKTIIVHNNVVLVRDRDEDSKSKFKIIEQDSVKTQAGQDRIIPLNSAAVSAMEDLQRFTGNETYVMTTKEKTLVKPRQLDQMFRRIVIDAGLPPEKVYGVHSLRHTFATLLLRNHVDIKTVSKLLGHNDVSTTYNTYIHVIKEVEVEAINSMPELTSN